MEPSTCLAMEGSDSFRMVNQDFEPDVVEILPQFDVLISDFSAMITDCLSRLLRLQIFSFSKMVSTTKYRCHVSCMVRLNIQAV